MDFDNKENEKRFIDKSKPDYKNKFYEMQDINIKNIKEIEKNNDYNSKDKKAKILNFNDKTDLNFSKFDPKTKSLNSDNSGLNIKNYSNKNSNQYYNKTSTNDSENFLVSASNQLLRHRIIRIFFSKKNFFNILGIPTQYSQMNIYARYWKLYDSLMILSNFFIMIFAFIDYETNFSYPRSTIPETYLFRYIIFIFSLFAIFCVISRHYYKQRWKNPNLYKTDNYVSYSEYNNIDIDDDDWFLDEHIGFIKNKFPKFFKTGLFIDILVNLLIPNPFFDFIIPSIEIDGRENKLIKIEYLYSDIMLILIIVRIIYLIRATINYSIFTDNYANSISKEFGVSCNIRFALKCILKTHHIKIVMLFFLASNLIFGFVLHVFERPFWASKQRIEFDFFSNSVWLIFVSMLTIGYGDLVPYTFFGRIIVMIASLWGVFIISLVVVCLYGLFDLSNNQFLVFVKIAKGRSAIKFIENAYLYRKTRFFQGKGKNDAKDDYDEMISGFNEFKSMRKESKSIYRSNGLVFYNTKLLSEMKKAMFKFEKMEYDVENLGNKNPYLNIVEYRKNKINKTNLKNNVNKILNLKENNNKEMGNSGEINIINEIKTINNKVNNNIINLNKEEDRKNK